MDAEQRPSAEAIGAEVDAESAGLIDRRAKASSAKPAPVASSSCCGACCGKTISFAAFLLLIALSFEVYSLRNELMSMHDNTFAVRDLPTPINREEAALATLHELGLGNTDAALRLRATLSSQAVAAASGQAAPSGLFALTRSSWNEQVAKLPLGKKIIIAGLQRSGSTTVYQLTIMWLRECDPKFDPNNVYIDDPNFPAWRFTEQGTALVKAHEIGPWLKQVSYVPGTTVILSHRAPDAQLTSFATSFTKGKYEVKCEELRKRQKCEYKHFHHVDYDLSLDELKAGGPTKLREVITKIADALGIRYTAADVSEVQRRYASMQQEQIQPEKEQRWNKKPPAALLAEIKADVASKCSRWQASGGSIEGNFFEPKPQDKCLHDSQVDKKGIAAPKVRAAAPKVGNHLTPNVGTSAVSSEPFALVRSSFAEQVAKLPLGKKVIIAGLQRSGSTTVYQITKMWLLEADSKFDPNNVYIDDDKFAVGKFSTKCTALVKAHAIGPWLKQVSTIAGTTVLLSHRAPEAQLTSYAMSFTHEKFEVPCDDLRRKQKCEYTHFHHVDYDMSVDELKAGGPAKLREVITKIADALGIRYTEADVSEVQRRYNSMQQEQIQPEKEQRWNKQPSAALAEQIHTNVVTTCGKWQQGMGSIESNAYVPRPGESCLENSKVDGRAAKQR